MHLAFAKGSFKKETKESVFLRGCFTMLSRLLMNFWTDLSSYLTIVNNWGYRCLHCTQVASFSLKGWLNSWWLGPLKCSPRDIMFIACILCSNYLGALKWLSQFYSWLGKIGSIEEEQKKVVCTPTPPVQLSGLGLTATLLFQGTDDISLKIDGQVSYFLQTTKQIGVQ